MSAQFTTIPLTEERLKLYACPKIIVVRLFQSPHFWCAGILRDGRIQNFDTVILQLQTSIRFKRDATLDAWIPGDSLIKMSIDHIIADTKDKDLDFEIKGAHTIVHEHFREETGIIGIQYEDGFVHLSFRGADLVSVRKLLETAGDKK